MNMPGFILTFPIQSEFMWVFETKVNVCKQQAVKI